eukprot:gb/GECH01012648.1/.p1 GENE.gb/GECH01012648.1/~~gb/GECH01012648.1/.p1  ORF type:complete len:280 (+),score=75.03 gb/GECH01012648.1/:1-840(+)
MYQVIIGQNLFNFSHSNQSGQSIINEVAKHEGLCHNDFYLSTRCKPLRSAEELCLSSSTPLQLDLNLRCIGGKGGFGSLLRGRAARAGDKKTTNFSACRDLHGRRLWHVETEKKNQESIQQEEETKKRIKEEKNKKAQQNKDEEMKLKGEYINKRSKTLDSVKDAVNNGIKKRKEKSSTASSSSMSSSDKDESKEEKKRKNVSSNSSISPLPKKKRKVMTAMDVLSDDSDSDNDDDDDNVGDLDDITNIVKPTSKNTSNKPGSSLNNNVNTKKPSVSAH